MAQAIMAQITSAITSAIMAGRVDHAADLAKWTTGPGIEPGVRRLSLNAADNPRRLEDFLWEML